MKIIKPSAGAAAKAAALLKRGGVIIVPTDTVYGFLADATNKKAVEKIYKIKNRRKNKYLPLFVSSIKMAHELAEIDIRQEKVLNKYWPGKYTFILKRYDARHRTKLYGVNSDTIALRIPRHPFLQKLIKKVGRPLVQTSVNISAQNPLKNIKDIYGVFGQNRLVGLIVASDRPLGGKSSKIIDLTNAHYQDKIKIRLYHKRTREKYVLFQ